MYWRATSLSTSNSINGKGGWESQQVKLNFTYRFGNKKVKESRQRNTSADEETKRAEKKDGMGL
jgi:hypothetical protein